MFTLLSYTIYFHFLPSCGSDVVSADRDDTLTYNCTDNSITETFSLKTYRYFGAAADAPVFIHCYFRVCLADEVDTACECPKNATTCVGNRTADLARRRRRSTSDLVDESRLYHAVSGPFTFKQEELNKDEGK